MVIGNSNPYLIKEENSPLKAQKSVKVRTPLHAKYSKTGKKRSKFSSPKECSSNDNKVINLELNQNKDISTFQAITLNPKIKSKIDLGLESDGFISDTNSSSSSQNSEESDSVSSVSEGDLQGFQQQPAIPAILEIDGNDSFTTDESSEESLPELSSHKAFNRTPSILSFLIMKDGRQKIIANQAISTTPEGNLQGNGGFSPKILSRRTNLGVALRSRSITSRNHQIKIRSQSTPKICQSAEVSSKHTCHCCDQKVFNNQDVACFSICEHRVHEFCLMELIEVSKYQPRNDTKPRGDIVFCPHCAPCEQI